ncbi:hypothetical protein C5860_21275 [Salmonella enterica]|nr:hypothetical protein [Salmonella enterica]
MKDLDIALNASRWEMVKSLFEDGDHAGIASFIKDVTDSENQKRNFQNDAIWSILELNDRIIALEELAAEYLAQQEAE